MHWDIRNIMHMTVMKILYALQMHTAAVKNMNIQKQGNCHLLQIKTEIFTKSIMMQRETT